LHAGDLRRARRANVVVAPGAVLVDAGTTGTK
jgi:hypothetical protein